MSSATAPRRVGGEGYRIDDAAGPMWLASRQLGWGDVVHVVRPDEVASADDVVVAGGLDWRVEQCRLEAVVGDASGDGRVPVTRHVANLRSDTRDVVGVVGSAYEPLQNRDALAFCEGITDSGRARWLGAGSTRGGSRVFGLMQLDREIRIGGATGEDLLPLLMLRNGHDGGLAVTVSVAPFRLACLNGMLLPLDGAVRTWRARHTSNLDGKLLEARRALGIAWHYYDQLEQTGAQLLATRVGEGAFERFLERLVPMPDRRQDETNGGRRVANVERVRQAIRDTHRDADDLADVRGTAWGALQAVGAYVDHVKPARPGRARTLAEARFERATEPAPLKDRALELLLQT